MMIERLPALAVAGLGLLCLITYAHRESAASILPAHAPAIREFSAGGITVRTLDPHAAGPLPMMGTVPDFALEERSGKPLRRSDLAGHVWIADFVFTRCTGPCLRMSGQMRGLSARLAAEPGLRLVTITVDPEHDTREVLRKYAQGLGASPDRWLFATGTAGAIYRLSRDGFKLGAGPNDPAAVDIKQLPFIHSTRLVLVDGRGSIRGYYDGDDAGAIEALVRDARSLAGDHP